MSGPDAFVIPVRGVGGRAGDRRAGGGGSGPPASVRPLSAAVSAAGLALLAAAASGTLIGRRPARAGEAELAAGAPVALAEGDLLVRPRVAFGAGVYLVAWQEGWPGLNGTADISAARVEAGSFKPLDSAPVKVCGAPESQSRPAVAAGADVFLVVWQDFRNGKDYDVRGAIVDARTGKIRVPDFEIAARQRNQARPAAAWTGRHFVAVWQEARGRDAYGVAGVRVSAEGKVLDSEPILYAEAGHSPAVRVSAGKVLVAWSDGQTASGCMADAETGKPLKSVGAKGKMNTRCPNDISLADDGQGNFMAVSARESFPNPWGWPGPGAVLCSRVNADGSAPEENVNYGYYLSDVCGRRVPNVVDTATWGNTDRWHAGAPGGFKGTADGMWPYGKPAVAWDGRGTWLFAWVKGKILPDRLNLAEYEIWLRGMDAKTLAVTLKDRKLAGGAGNEAKDPAIEAGPAGEFLLAYESAPAGGKMRIEAIGLRAK
ncbi:MAG: hypothetical protein N3A38_09645 [Planctomycetota bacterium]|nr:hypothetical protein [Planctomycetota bacterium]